MPQTIMLEGRGLAAIVSVARQSFSARIREPKGPLLKANKKEPPPRCSQWPFVGNPSWYSSPKVAQIALGASEEIVFGTRWESGL